VTDPKQRFIENEKPKKINTLVIGTRKKGRNKTPPNAPITPISNPTPLYAGNVMYHP
jgi:hypothetical protein